MQKKIPRKGFKNTKKISRKQYVSAQKDLKKRLNVNTMTIMFWLTFYKFRDAKRDPKKKVLRTQKDLKKTMYKCTKRSQEKIKCQYLDNELPVDSLGI